MSNDDINNNENDEILNNIDSYLTFIKYQFHTDISKDIVIREFLIADKYRAFIAYFDGMADRNIVNNFILRPLMNLHNLFSNTNSNTNKNINNDVKNKDKENNSISIEYIMNNIIEINQCKHSIDPQEIITEILMGNVAVFIDGNAGAICCETKGYSKRNVEKPQSEGIVKGAHEGFTEHLLTNINLVRRIVKNKDLIMEYIEVGERNNGLCAVFYLDGLANKEVVNEVKRRIKGISTDLIAGSGMLEQFIEDDPNFLFPQILSTERPDRTAANIIEGRVAVIVEGTPTAIIMPVTLATLLQSSEDYSLKWQFASMLRIIRIFALFFGILLPGLYIAMNTYHSEMIPTDLVIAIAKARENVPFPTILEIILMEFSFELIREAGIRIPGLIGNTIGIIGALILGQSAVEANLVSPILIIIIAFTGLANFANPDFNLGFGVRLLRFLFIILGAALGFMGISLGIILTLSIFTTAKSFGVPFLAPYSPTAQKGNDLLIRKPVWKQEMRPDEINAQDKQRQPKISRLWSISKKAKDFYLDNETDINEKDNGKDEGLNE